jgi:hypothetical protein
MESDAGVHESVAAAQAHLAAFLQCVDGINRHVQALHAQLHTVDSETSRLRRGVSGKLSHMQLQSIPRASTPPLPSPSSTRHDGGYGRVCTSAMGPAVKASGGCGAVGGGASAESVGSVSTRSGVDFDGPLRVSTPPLPQRCHTAVSCAVRPRQPLRSPLLTSTAGTAHHTPAPSSSRHSTHREAQRDARIHCIMYIVALSCRPGSEHAAGGSLAGAVVGWTVDVDTQPLPLRRCSPRRCR